MLYGQLEWSKGAMEHDVYSRVGVYLVYTERIKKKCDSGSCYSLSVVPFRCL